MARAPFVALLASVLCAPASGQDAAGKGHTEEGRAEEKASPPDLFPNMRPDMARALRHNIPPIDPTGEFVYLDAPVDARRQPGDFPPEDISVVEKWTVCRFGGCKDVWRLKVPVGRVPEIKAFLEAVAPRLPPMAKF